jgi:hypothetical protein
VQAVAAAAGYRGGLGQGCGSSSRCAATSYAGSRCRCSSKDGGSWSRGVAAAGVLGQVDLGSRRRVRACAAAACHMQQWFP